VPDGADKKPSSSVCTVHISYVSVPDVANDATLRIDGVCTDGQQEPRTV